LLRVTALLLLSFAYPGFSQLRTSALSFKHFQNDCQKAITRGRTAQFSMNNSTNDHRFVTAYIHKTRYLLPCPSTAEKGTLFIP